MAGLFLLFVPHGDVPAVQTGKPSIAICDRAAFRTVVDVGHTAQDPGAISARGVPEYEFNLRLATRIEAKLVDAGFAKTVLLVTKGAARAGLMERVARANAMEADLFISIHHDSVPASFIEKWVYEGAEGRYSDRFKGHSIFVSNENGGYEKSVVFASMLGQALKSRSLAYTPHYTEKFMGARQRVLVDAEAGVYRFDRLIVLKDTTMPAVLLEAGSIIHRDEELEMASPDRQLLTASSVVEAVEAFCAAP